MKKCLLFAGALALVFAFSSCKKDYTCECTSVVVGLSTASVETTIRDTKNKAKDACEDMSNSLTVGGITTTTTCKIK